MPTFGNHLFKNNMDKDILESKLKKFFIVGGGAWQELWEPEETPKSMGFNPSSDTVKPVEISQKKLQSSIQPELLRRFRAEVLVMTPLDEEDYKQLIAEFSKNLPKEIRQTFRELAHEGIENAVETNLGMRFFEETLTNTLTHFLYKEPILPPCI